MSQDDWISWGLPLCFLTTAGGAIAIAKFMSWWSIRSTLRKTPSGNNLNAMPDEPDNLVLRYLRRIDEKLDTVASDVRELKTRVGLLEQQYASLSSRVDRIEMRLERIEKRLDLVGAP